MRKKRLAPLLLLVLLGVCDYSSAFGQTFERVRRAPLQSYKDIVQQFARKEAEFKREWQEYTYTQRILFQVLDKVGRVKEQREMLVDVYFTNEGERKYRILKDRGSLRSVRVSKEDLEDALHRQPFVLTTDELPKYKIEFLRKERLDELRTFVFTVQPKVIRKGERYFKGRVWIDDQDLQIVMSQSLLGQD